MTSREYFEQAREAGRALDRIPARLVAMRAREGVRGQGYDAMPHGNGVGDPMAATDARMDAEGRILAEQAQYRAVVADALEVIAGLREANPLHPLWADVIEMRYIHLQPWRMTAQALGISERTAFYEHDAAMDWLDHAGIANAKEGRGGTALV